MIFFQFFYFHFILNSQLQILNESIFFEKIFIFLMLEKKFIN